MLGVDQATLTGSARSAVRSTIPSVSVPVTFSNARLCSWKSRNSSASRAPRKIASGRSASRTSTSTIRLEPAYVNGSSSTLWITLYITVTEPMPRPSVRTATAVKPQSPASWRAP